MIAKSLLPLGISMLCIALTGCERQVSYAADVRPILDNYCIECHSGSGEGEGAPGRDQGECEQVLGQSFKGA